MATRHLYVLAVAAGDAEADALERLVLVAANLFGIAPLACAWQPDRDTVADALGCGYDELRVHDLNPAPPTPDAQPDKVHDFDGPYN